MCSAQTVCAPYDGKSISDSAESAALEAVFDGVDDLFNLVDVRSELAKSVCDGRNHEVRMSLKGDAETTLFRNTRRCDHGAFERGCTGFGI